MTFNDVLGLVVALEDLGFEVTKTGFSYKKGIRTWHVYVDIKMNEDWSMAYVSYDKYVRDGKIEINTKVSYTLPIERLVNVLVDEFDFISHKECERIMAEI